MPSGPGGRAGVRPPRQRAHRPSRPACGQLHSSRGRVASVAARPSGGMMKKLILILAVVAIATLIIKALGKEGILE